MKWKINLSSAARRDIQSALEWTFANFGPDRTEKYSDLIRLALKEIALNPNSPRSKSRPEIYTDALTFHIGRRGSKARHLFLYHINPRGLVEVCRSS